MISKPVICEYCSQVVGYASNWAVAMMLGWKHSFECPSQTHTTCEYTDSIVYALSHKQRGGKEAVKYGGR